MKQILENMMKKCHLVNVLEKRAILLFEVLIFGIVGYMVAAYLNISVRDLDGNLIDPQNLPPPEGTFRFIEEFGPVSLAFIIFPFVVNFWILGILRGVWAKTND